MFTRFARKRFQYDSVAECTGLVLEARDRLECGILKQDGLGLGAHASQNKNRARHVQG